MKGCKHFFLIFIPLQTCVCDLWTRMFLMCLMNMHIDARVSACLRLLTHTQDYYYFSSTMPSLLNTPGGLCKCVCVNKRTLKGSLFATIRHGPTKLTFLNDLRIMRPSSTACEQTHYKCLCAHTAVQQVQQ